MVCIRRTEPNNRDNFGVFQTWILGLTAKNAKFFAKKGKIFYHSAYRGFHRSHEGLNLSL
ncbi:hypothetical protein DU508_15060 [Pedobacter chinensis]|uniref:Uncharacterized protein n=1 Tax=Pedobacter chinensis TaxID=2282421 RepID=A0A369PX87_9SPHI|nr:hypothetical protein DU508_15060 [Pedobacter chinensis]